MFLICSVEAASQSLCVASDILDMVQGGYPEPQAQLCALTTGQPSPLCLPSLALPLRSSQAPLNTNVRVCSLFIGGPEGSTQMVNRNHGG